MFMFINLLWNFLFIKYSSTSLHFKQHTCWSLRRTEVRQFYMAWTMVNCMYYTNVIWYNTSLWVYLIFHLIKIYVLTVFIIFFNYFVVFFLTTITISTISRTKQNKCQFILRVQTLYLQCIFTSFFKKKKLLTINSK